MLIAQITDLHVRAVDGPGPLGIQINENVMALVAQLNVLQPRPDLVVATGDLTASGESDQYRRLSEILSSLDLPLYLIPGNHDEPGPFQELLGRFPGLSGDGDLIQIASGDQVLRLIALDSTVPGYHNGALTDARLAWLDTALNEAPDEPTLIFMHHPPIESGIWWMDCIGLLEGREALAELLEGHGQVQAILSGHLHRTILSRIAGVPVIVAPSSCYAVGLDLREKATPSTSDEPPGFMLHHWDGKRLSSHTLFIQGSWTNHDIRPLMADWEARAKLMDEGQPIPKIHGMVK